ncbi:MAG TPA: hypothetical protein VFN87_01865 [Solirubrobacteraceae bacterium]|nr:hypothetical protein [Solirubrobacteraceae bacterium]
MTESTRDHGEASDQRGGGRRRTSILPDDPLVRWIFWLILFVSVGAPALFSLVLLVTQ